MTSPHLSLSRVAAMARPVRLARLGVLVGSTLSAAALAGFIDERKGPAVPQSATADKPVAAEADPGAPKSAGPVMAPSGQPSTQGVASSDRVRPPALIGFSPSWATPAQAGATNLPLHVALRVLRPAAEPEVPVMLQGVPPQIMVSWPEGAVRLAVVADIAAKNGLTLRNTPSGLLVFGAGTPSRAEETSTQAAVPAGPGPRKFEVRLQDVRLHVAMQRWAADTGVRLRWDAERHVLISAPMVFEAPDALQAIGMALSTPGIANSAYPLEVCAYPNVPLLLRITRQGEQSKDCTN